MSHDSNSVRRDTEITSVVARRSNRKELDRQTLTNPVKPQSLLRNHHRSLSSILCPSCPALVHLHHRGVGGRVGNHLRHYKITIQKCPKRHKQPANSQSMRYFRLKNARRCRICHAPRQANEKMVNQAKFCTRSFVEAERQCTASEVGQGPDR